jgi:hypothetical protein
MFGNEWFLSLERSYSKINAFTMYYFTQNWKNTFMVHVRSLITFEFLLFIKSQFITNAPNILHLNQCTHGHFWSWTVAPFQRSRDGCEWCDRHKKCVGEVSLLHFQLELNTEWFLSVRTFENQKDWGRHVVGLYFEK